MIKGLPKIRLFIEAKLVATNSRILDSQLKIANSDFDYLTKVMRQKIGDKIRVFDGVNGEFIAEIVEIEKKFLMLEIKEKVFDLKKVPNITLAFAPVKNVRIDFVASKATELGVARFQPILTQRSVVDKINIDRFKANVKEACEQCERNDFPEIFSIKKLETYLEEKSLIRKIYILCDESGKGEKASIALPKIFHDFSKMTSPSHVDFVVVIGPEGGFSESEFNKFSKIADCHSISLGPRILRADTAVISALTLVQEFIGNVSL